MTFQTITHFEYKLRRVGTNTFLFNRDFIGFGMFHHGYLPVFEEQTNVFWKTEIKGVEMHLMYERIRKIRKAEFKIKNPEADQDFIDNIYPETELIKIEVVSTRREIPQKYQDNLFVRFAYVTQSTGYIDEFSKKPNDSVADAEYDFLRTQFNKKRFNPDWLMVSDVPLRMPNFGSTKVVTKNIYSQLTASNSALQVTAFWGDDTTISFMKVALSGVKRIRNLHDFSVLYDTDK